MTIQEFSNKAKLSCGTIQYYIRAGLLLPTQQADNMVFTEREYDDLLYLRKLKRMRFTESEIRTLLTPARKTGDEKKEAMERCKALFAAKKQKLEHSIEQKQQALRIVEAQFAELELQQSQPKCSLGVSLKALSRLACPYCGSPLLLESSAIVQGNIQSGSLSCVCGYSAFVRDGILSTKANPTGTLPTPWGSERIYSYTQDNQFIPCVQQSCDAIFDALTADSLKDKVVLESTVDRFCFLHRHLQQLEANCLYILIDACEDTLQRFKGVLERLGVRRDLLLIVGDGDALPLKAGCVDVLIDFFGENDYLLSHTTLFVQDAARCFSPQLRVVGACLYYDEGSKSKELLGSSYPSCPALNYSEHGLERMYRKLGYAVEFKKIGKTTKTDDKYNYSCHIRGENLYFQYYETNSHHVLTELNGE